MKLPEVWSNFSTGGVSFRKMSPTAITEFIAALVWSRSAPLFKTVLSAQNDREFDLKRRHNGIIASNETAWVFLLLR